MERKIGEIFEYNGEWYQCVENCVSWCASCDFRKKDCNTLPLGPCDAIRRSDKRCAIFKKLEPVGDPYPLYDHIVQRYVGVKFPVALTEKRFINCNEINNTIDIEVKQDKENKEDMEEKKVKVSRENWDYLVDKLQYILADHLHGGESYEVIAEFENLLEIDNPEEKKLNLKPFDLEKAKAGKPVCTRDGRKARIICFDRVGDFPIVALTDDRDYKEEGVNLYDINGKGSNECFDLMMLPEKKEGWVNVYYDNDASSHRGCRFIYDTKERAVKEAGSSYITTVKINWEE